jgi:cellulose synthase/poly-beta-1,6-N-acetylglucosamine synthase-like glycosyltransferase
MLARPPATDLQITVELMKMNEPIKLYNKITALTYVPETFKGLFLQRRRWERGTIKVLWADRKFYSRQFFRVSFFPIALLLHFALYVCVMVFAVTIAVSHFTAQAILSIFLESYLIWLVIDFVKGAWVALKTEPHRFPLFCFAALINGPIWLFLVIPARLVGGCEALWSILTRQTIFKRDSK